MHKHTGAKITTFISCRLLVLLQFYAYHLFQPNVCAVIQALAVIVVDCKLFYVFLQGNDYDAVSARGGLDLAIAGGKTSLNRAGGTPGRTTQPSKSKYYE